MKDTEDVYDQKVAALAVNFGERLYESGYEEDDGGRMDRLIIAALNAIGYKDIDAKKLNRTIEYYTMPTSPIFGSEKFENLSYLPEYEAELPDLDYDSIG